MAPNPPVLSSAVIVPEAEDLASQGHTPAKRRQSSISTEDSKRPRLSSPQEQPRVGLEAGSQSSTISKERVGRDSEERKRGKRLFGALLGTLNQSSSSTAQRRRGDIERKQQEKLRNQAQEHDEQLKKDRDALLNARRLEHDIYVKQAAKTRRENELTCARFLQTAAEPKLYYRPWDLLSEQKAKIDAQITSAQKAAENEVANETNTQKQPDETKKDPSGEQGEELEKPANRAPADGANGPGVQEAAVTSDAAMTDPKHDGRTGPPFHRRDESEASRDVPEDGGDDYVKGDEDDVIY